MMKPMMNRMHALIVGMVLTSCTSPKPVAQPAKVRVSVARAPEDVEGDLNRQMLKLVRMLEDQHPNPHWTFEQVSAEKVSLQLFELAKRDMLMKGCQCKDIECFGVNHRVWEARNLMFVQRQLSLHEALNGRTPTEKLEVIDQLMMFYAPGPQFLLLKQDYASCAARYDLVIEWPKPWRKGPPELIRGKLPSE